MVDYHTKEALIRELEQLLNKTGQTQKHQEFIEQMKGVFYNLSIVDIAGDF